MIEHTISAAGITARELRASDLSPDLIEGLLNAASWVNSLIGMGAVVPNEDDGADVAGANEAMDALSDVLNDAWRLHSKPASTIFDVVREGLNAIVDPPQELLPVRL